MDDKLKESYLAKQKKADEAYDSDMELLEKMLDNENLTLTERKTLGLLLRAITNFRLSTMIDFRLIDN